jgi:hypothetical protein
MKSIKENLEVFQIQAPCRAYRAGWEVLADEMTGYFGENCFWLFRRKEEWKIRNAYQICRGKQIRSFRYLMGILKNV